ncbi:conserved hypothetical protein, partial [sediment metagenome]
SGSYGPAIRIWDVATGESKIMEGHNFFCLAVLSDGRLASGSYDIRIWDVETGKAKFWKGTRTMFMSCSFV